MRSSHVNRLPGRVSLAVAGLAVLAGLTAGCGSPGSTGSPAAGGGSSAAGGPSATAAEGPAPTGGLDDYAGPAKAPKMLWRSKLEVVAGALGPDLVFLARTGQSTTGTDWTFTALNGRTGEQSWTLGPESLPAGGTFVGPVVLHDGALYALVQQGQRPAAQRSKANTLVKFAPGARQPTWTAQLPTTVADGLLGGYLGISGRDIQVQLGGAGGTANFALDTGAPTGQGPARTLPADGLANHDGLYTEQNLLLDTSTRVQVRLPGSSSVCGWNKTLLVGGAANDWKPVQGVDRTSLTTLWTSTEQFHCLTVTGNDLVLVETRNGEMSALNGKDGSRRWAVPYSENFLGVPIFVGGGLIVLGRSQRNGVMVVG